MARRQFETFRDIGLWEIGNLEQKEPSAFNGMIRFRKQRVTIEDVEEPTEVLALRLQKLWEECDNMHLYEPIKREAKSIGYELQGSVGSKVKGGSNARG